MRIQFELRRSKADRQIRALWPTKRLDSRFWKRKWATVKELKSNYTHNNIYMMRKILFSLSRRPRYPCSLVWGTGFSSDRLLSEPYHFVLSFDWIHHRVGVLRIMANFGPKATLSSLLSGIRRVFEFKGSNKEWSFHEKQLALEVRDIVSQRL